MAEAAFADPPGMPEDERMTPAEFKVVREFLGLTGDWLAGHLGVSPRTVRHWEQGKYAIPDGVRLAIEDLETRTATFVSGIADALMDLPDPGVITYRDDAEYHAAHPESDWPASWHRAVVARVAQEVPGLSIVYADQVPGREVADEQASQRGR
jgi:transcriptional regulator with XRE-family HTH domain